MLPEQKTPSYHPTTLDILLADIAIRIQLRESDHVKAVNRYETIAEWLERSGSPLKNCVNTLYAQGSMAIGATIASKLRNDEFDIDVIADLRSPTTIDPHRALNLLYESIKGERGSRYYDMTKRQTRCVTVYYSDNMHLDITPAVLLPMYPARTSYIFHSRPEEPVINGKRIIANPYGFAEWFKRKTPLDHAFAALFEKRIALWEGTLLMKAQDAAEKVPEHQPAHSKSKALIVLQLLKRWRNIRYDNREGRQPPSILMAKMVADVAGNTQTLGEELLLQSEAMLKTFKACQSANRLIHITNPACPDDVLTDRWPATLKDQAIFIADLEDLVRKARLLVSGISLADMKLIMVNLFGENATAGIFEDLIKRQNQTIASGNAYSHPGRGQLDLIASGIATGAASKTAGAIPTRPHTFFGD